VTTRSADKRGRRQASNADRCDELEALEVDSAGKTKERGINPKSIANSNSPKSNG